MEKQKRKGIRRRLVAIALGFDIEDLLKEQGEHITMTVHEEVQAVKDAVLGYKSSVEEYVSTVEEEMSRVEKDLQDLRAPGGGSDAQDLADLADSINQAKENIAQKKSAVANFELPVSATDTTGTMDPSAAPAEAPANAPVEVPASGQPDASAQGQQSDPNKQTDPVQ